MTFPRYPKYKDSGVEWLGEVPEHWTITSLKRVVDPNRPITYGIVQAGPHFPDGVPYIRPADMTDEDGVSAPDGLMRTSAEIAEGYSRSTIRSGDLVCSIGPSFGKVMITPEWLSAANLTQGTARIAVTEFHDRRYMFWTLRSRSSVCQWESSIGGATFRALNLGPLAETIIPVPSLDEQARVAAFLDRETRRIDELVAEQQRLMGLLKEKRQAVISHAVTKGLNPHAPMKPSGIDWLGDVPAHWQILRLKDLSPRVSGRLVYQPAQYFSDEGVPFLMGNNVTENGIEWSDVKLIPDEINRSFSQHALREGDVITVRVGAPGVTCVVPREADGLNCGSLMIIRRSTGFDSHWLAAVMNSSIIRRQIDQFQYGAAQEQINITDAVNFRIPTPPVDEQRAIASFLGEEGDRFDLLAAEAKKAIDLLQERRTALISAAVTGQIDVRELAAA